MHPRQGLRQIAIAFIGDDDRSAGFGDQKIGAGHADIGGQELVAQDAARLGQQRCRFRKVTVRVQMRVDAAKIGAYLNYSKVIDKFYSAGNNTAEIDNPNYEARSSLALIKFQRQISHNLNAGIVYEIRNYSVVDVRENPYLQSGMVYGEGGGLTSGLGFVVSYDSRNNIFYPESGGFYELSSTFFTGEIGSDFGYTKTIIDLRRFQKIAGNQILAFQMFYNFITGSSPFYDVPPLGGENIMRGYFTGRYRDRHYFATQIEYRIRVWWRFGLVGFIGMGDVASNVSKFELNKFKFSYGLGVRFRIDEIELIDLRADVGFDKNTSGIYFSLNQAF